ncbi:hypothetical protein GQ53DRAFT_853512 [Thozetella sp. PMI_491]|nr:hypothetical protein GQ53DRAFT_853512 [Thozetella sp. PMI_491]
MYGISDAPGRSFIMAVSHSLRMSRRDVSSSPVYAGSLSLGALMAIVLVGAIVLAAGMGTLVLFLSRRRASQRARYVEDGSGEDTDITAIAPRPAVRKLQKRDAIMIEKMRSASPVPPTEAVGDRNSAPPTLPPLTIKRISFNPFRASWSKPAPAHKPRPSWIDEDALHGPKVTKQEEGRRRSIRESWPLKNMMPTLPRLVGSGSSQQNAQAQKEQEPPVASGAASLPASHDQLHEIPARNLPRPPKSALIVHRRQPPRNAIQIAGNVYITNDPQRLQSTLNITPTRQAARMSSTDSTLSEILKSTERRLQEGTSTGVARRNKAAAAAVPLKTHTSPLKPSTPARASPRLRSKSATPSPGGSQPMTPPHNRQLSATSLFSEPDSLFEDPRPSPVPDALASSGRKPPARSRSYSLSSSVSSSLSTVYSMDETQEGTTMISTPPNSSLPELPQILTESAASSSDPFLISTSMLPSSPGSSGDQGGWTESHSPREGLTLKRPPKLSNSSPEQNASVRKRDAGAPSQGSLAPESTSPAQGKRSTMGHPNEFYDPPTPRGECLDNFDVLASAVRASLDQHAFTSPRPSPSKPCLIITSPSDASSIRTLASGLSVGYISPGQVLKATKSSPALGSQEFGPGDIPAVPPLPEFAKKRLAEGDGPPSPTRKAHQRRPKPRISSTSSSLYSQDTKDDLARLVGETNSASCQLNALAGMTLAPSHDPVKRECPQPLERSGSARLGLGATIAELRRMNSAVSTYSTYSKCSTQANDEGSPTLPDLRGGGFSPTHRKGGSKHYLSMGSPPKPDAAGSVAETEEEMFGSSPLLTLKMPRLEVPSEMSDKKQAGGLREGDGGNRATPPKMGMLAVDNGEGHGKRLLKRISTESLGLYDKDGFLISSPIRVTSPAKEPETARRSPGLRV